MTVKSVRILAAFPIVIVLMVVASRSEFITSQSASPQKSAPVKEKAVQANPENKSAAPASKAELSQRIDELIDQGPFSSARWGISVISLPDGGALYHRNADKSFTPASNMKVYTTAVALELLGADYRWRTSVYSTTQPDAAGTIQGDLVLYGRGAPDLVSISKDGSAPSLEKLAEDLYARGVRRVNGNVIGDESYFRGNALGDGWQWNDIQWYFGAEASALSINENQVDVNVFPSSKSGESPEVKVNNADGVVTIDNRMAVAGNATRSTVGLHRGLSDNKVEVWGEFAPGMKGFGARLSVHDPALWAAKLFAQALKTKGITVQGQTHSRTSRVPPGQRFDGSRAIELAGVNSNPLSQIAKKTNKDSNNLYAELILRTLGKERAAMLEMPEPPGRERGDEEAGLALIRLWLARNGIWTEGLALHDGSGLSRLNLVSPESTVRLLLSLSRNQIFRESLPIAGRDGTLGGRLRTAVDRVSAKTGSLTYDNSLSGYVTTLDGKQLAFSIYCNDHTGRGNSIRLIDEIVGVIAGSPQGLRKTPEKAH